MFELDVISDPGASLAPNTPMWLSDLNALVDYDIALVKPSLLFADKVTLFSFRASMRQRVEAEAYKLAYMMMRILPEFIDLVISRDARALQLLGMAESQLPPVEEARAIKNLRRRAMEELRVAGSHSLTGQIAEQSSQFIAKYESQIDEYRQRAFEMWKHRWLAMEADELDQAVSEGVLDIAGWTDDGEVPPHKLAFEDEQDFLVRSTSYMATYISQGGHVPMIDPGAHFILGMNQEDPRQSISTSDVLSPASIAASMAARLPGLQKLTVAEVIDLRAYLNPYLSPFRVAMIAMADDIASSSPGEGIDIRRELDRRWYGEVAPCLTEIENEMRKSKYLRRLLTAMTTDKSSLAGLASGVALGVGSLAAGFAAVTPAAVLGVAWPFLQSLREMVEQQEAVKSQKLYFLYRAKKYLSE